MQIKIPDPKFVLFLTDWGLCSTFIYMAYSSALSIIYLFNKRNTFIQSECIWKFSQFLFIAALDLELVVTSAYWVSQLFIDTDDPRIKTEIRLQHFVPCLFMAIEFGFNHMRMKFRHFILLQFIYLPYLVLNVLYTYISGQGVYPVVDWDNLQSIGAIFFIEGLAVIFCLITREFSKCKPNYNHSNDLLAKEEDEPSCVITE
jgi:hypothetical protein